MFHWFFLILYLRTLRLENLPLATVRACPKNNYEYIAFKNMINVRLLSQTQYTMRYISMPSAEEASLRSFISKVITKYCLISISNPKSLLASRIHRYKVKIMNILLMTLRYIHWFTTFSLRPKDVTTWSNVKNHCAMKLLL